MSLNLLSSTNLAEYTSWLIGGPADHFCLPKTVEELQEALLLAKKNQWPVTILGGGSNVLVSDKGIRGLTIGLRRFSSISHHIEEMPIGAVAKGTVPGREMAKALVDKDQLADQRIDRPNDLPKKEKGASTERLIIECLSGTSKSELLKLFLKYQLEPALFLAGLPGDVGGGVVMNAGVAENFNPREFMEMVDWIEVMTKDGEVHKLKNTDLTVKYRHTDGWQPHIIVRVGLSWPYEKKPEILQKVREANKTRLTKQPLDMPSCGSVFKNPEGYKAAQLIDQCGLKGFRMGDAQVSTKHANFIVNLGTARAVDVWAVIQHVQQEVLRQKGIGLTTEVVRLGEW